MTEYNAYFDKMLEGLSRAFIAEHFALFARTEQVSRMLVRYEMMKRITTVKGCIVECGVKDGDGLMQWLHLIQLMEPKQVHRVIVGFDTFEGFPSVSPNDGKDKEVGNMKPWITLQGLAMCITHIEDQFRLMTLNEGTSDEKSKKFELQMPSRICAVKGDFLEKADEFMAACPSLVVALLHLDFDLYEPTKKALEVFLPRMPKGAVLMFDELNHPGWPGETIAAMEVVGLRNLELKQFPFEPFMSYAVL